MFPWRAGSWRARERFGGASPTPRLSTMRVCLRPSLVCSTKPLWRRFSCTYGCESWVLLPSKLRALEGFHVECARRLTGMRPRKVRPNRCMCPKSAEVPKKDNLKSLRYYIHPKTPTHRLRQCLVPSRPGGVQGGGGGLKGSPLRKYWWDLPMEAPKEEDAGPSGVGAFFRRSDGG